MQLFSYIFITSRDFSHRSEIKLEILQFPVKELHYAATEFSEISLKITFLRYHTDTSYRTHLQSIFYFFGSQDFDRRPEGRVGGERDALFVHSVTASFLISPLSSARFESANRFSRLPFSLSFAQELIMVNRLHCSITRRLKRGAAAHRTRCSCQISVYA